MDRIRKCFHIEDGKILAVLNKSNFWKGVVEETELQLKNNIQVGIHDIMRMSPVSPQVVDSGRILCNTDVI